jgi:N-methylhydantoinase B
MRAPDVRSIQVLRNALEATAQEMGAVLKLTSFRPTSGAHGCVVRDLAGAKPSRRPSMCRSTWARSARGHHRRGGTLDPGDVVVNDPFIAGAHLPDITLLAPVHAGDLHIGCVATRPSLRRRRDGPGSMPGNSQEIYQEGVIIPPVKLYRSGVLQHDVLNLVLANVRTPQERRGDFNAQLAAIRIGERRIGELAERYGAERLAAGFEAILSYAERRMRKQIADLPSGEYSGEDRLDDDGRSTGRWWSPLAGPDGARLAGSPRSAGATSTRSSR